MLWSGVVVRDVFCIHFINRVMWRGEAGGATLIRAQVLVFIVGTPPKVPSRREREREKERAREKERPLQTLSLL